MDKQKQARLEELRDLIVSKETNAAVGRAMGSTEINTDLDILRAEYEQLKGEQHASWNAASEAALQKRLESETEERRVQIRQLIKQHSLDELREKREAARLAQESARAEFAIYSAALSFVEAGERLRKQLEAATPEEREALALLG